MVILNNKAITPCHCIINYTLINKNLLIFWSFLSGIQHNNQCKWIAERPGKGEFVSVKPRQPKPATSHTDSLLKDGSTAEMTVPNKQMPR